MADGAAIDALRAAVDAAPADHELRLVLARRLLDTDRADEALGHADHVLDASPAHVEALRVAADAAAAAGRSDQAVGFRRLLTALGDDGEVPLTSADVLGGGASAHEPVAAARVGELVLEPAPAAAPAPPALASAPPAAVTLDDVGGHEDVKQWLRRTYLAPLRSPALRDAFRISPRGSLLLYGPPGCGKRFLARALAGELAAVFRPVDPVVDPVAGPSAQRLAALFDEARRGGPCVLFLDDLDALAPRPVTRHDGRGRDVAPRLLSDLDDLGDDHRLIVLASTSRPWDVDPALRQPGRFDRALLVPPPDRHARLAIIARQLADRPIELIDLVATADASEGCSAADLVAACDAAAEAALARSVQLGSLSLITAADLERALGQLTPGPARWLEAARRHADAAAGYDELAAFLRSRRAG